MPPTNMNPEKAEEWRAKQSSLYSHPADLACFRQSTGFIANMLAEKMPQADALLFAKELSAALFGEEIVEVEICAKNGTYRNGRCGLRTAGMQAYSAWR